MQSSSGTKLPRVQKPKAGGVGGRDEAGARGTELGQSLAPRIRVFPFPSKTH